MAIWMIDLPPGSHMSAAMRAKLESTGWTDTNALPDIRNYRIKIPFSQP